MAEGLKGYAEETLLLEYEAKVKPRMEDVRRMFFEGYSFGDVAKELGVPNTLLWRMRRNKKPQYAELRDAFEFQDCQIQNVETSLYRKAVGFYYEEDEKVATMKEYYNRNGEKCKEPVVKTVRVRKYAQPDVNAIKFFLVNRAASRYSPEGSGADKARDDAMAEAMRNVYVEVKRRADDAPNSPDPFGKGEGE